MEVSGFVSGEYLADKLAQVAKQTQIAAFHVKVLLKYVNVETWTQTFDAEVAAYLLNPLKTAYDYEDIGKEYLGQIFPGRQEVVGKKGDKDALAEKPEEMKRLGCFMAYVALAVKLRWKRLCERQVWRGFFRRLRCRWCLL